MLSAGKGVYTCIFTISAGRFLLIRIWWVHMLVLSFLSFCNAWHPQRVFFQFVRCLPNNPFPLCVSASSVDVTALRKHAVFFISPGSNFKPQNKAFTVCFFKKKKKGAQNGESHSTKETRRTYCIFSPSPRHAYCSSHTPHVNHVKSRKSR